MDVFQLRTAVVDEYSAYIKSFLRIDDTQINDFVQAELASGRLWPDPLVQLNPAFEPGETVEELARRGVLAQECARIFRRAKDDNGFGASIRLHRHQQQAIEAAQRDGSYVLTTGTGSGKSLAYFIPIVDHVLRQGPRSTRQGIAAIVVYPMNALCNSQMEELKRFLRRGYGENQEPVTFARYTGQESEEERKAIADSPPDILLTNYMMLELLLTRMDPNDERVIAAAHGLQFLVLDELHTYRGRQGADVAMLVRRVRERCGAPTLRCIGTSATMAGAGTREERAAQVAGIATRLFGDHVPAENVIGETLRRAITRPAPTIDELRTALSGAAEYPADYEALATHPLAAWAEMAFGLATDARGRLERRQPVTMTAAAQALARETDTAADTCRAHLRALLLAGYATTNPATGFPLFAFRLHQFVSRGDAVYGSIEPAATRALTMEGQVYVPGDRQRRLYPLAFCRECGASYHVVDRPAIGVLAPRALNAVSDDPQVSSGFILPDPDERYTLDLDTLPEDWLETRKDGSIRVHARARGWLPQPVYVAPDGACAAEETPGAMHALFLPAPFRYCPSCSVSYSSSTRSDFGKLAMLSTEGRSTATTILSLTVVQALRGDESLAHEARKLLSFTDNRQDASLQAGHFNDFIQIGLLRAALYAAVAATGDEGLTHDTVARAATAHLQLEPHEYTTNPDAQFLAKQKIEQALRDAIGYRIYRDQERGWRVTAPNLEQVGLLRVRYDALDALCAAEDIWQGRHAILAAATPGERQRACQTVLDTLRRELAIKVSYLDPEQQEKLVQGSFQFLKEPWALDEDTLRTATAVWVGPKERGALRSDLSISATSGLGHYLRRPSTWPSYLEAGQKLAAAELEPLARDLCEALVVGGQLEPTEERRGTSRTYHLQAGCIRWLAGDGTPPPPDPVRVTRPTKELRETNAYFRDFYARVALALRGIEAREHTAQVPAAIREEREHAFRDGDLSVLYCSPTMELGVDIADLSVVNMRNVPPTPANYAQRSGRAGRSGQPALVLTYCSSNSPHDQYFFRVPARMVAGQVVPPRLDLANEDLVRAHLHAVWLAETRQSLGTTLTHVLDLEAPEDRLPIQEAMAQSLRSEHATRRAATRCERILQAMADDLADVPWYTARWLESVIAGAYRAFDQACDRWRGLYRAARRQQALQNAIVTDASASPESREAAQRLRGEAETQLKLLTEEEAGAMQSDFYSYRYFASEGFLPGYNFPRLPLAAYLPGRHRSTGRDEFLSRPRFLAVSEFGPGAIIYHEGSQYRVTRVLLSVQESGERTLTAKFCGNCGYGHVGDVSGDERCHFCDALLSGLGTQYFSNLLRLDNVATRRANRITSDEEERRRRGYEMKTALRFAQNTQGLDYTQAVARAGESELASLTYAPTATLWRLNLGWNRRKDKSLHGFLLDLETGEWSKKERATVDASDEGGEDLDETMARVVPFVEDRRNALVLQMAESLDEAAMASLEYALKRGIEAVYQIEDRELEAEPLPSMADRRRILFYESAEGGAGVLARLIHEPGALARVARSALETLHFDPDTAEDRRRPVGAEEDCEAACYACLLSYANQREHAILDRHRVRDILVQLAAVETRAGSGTRAPAAALAALEAACGSDLERAFVRHLHAGGYRLPDHAGAVVQSYGTRPDFYYNDPPTCVYVDGPVHDYPERLARDADVTARLQDGGYEVIRVAGPDTWDGAIRSSAWVFGPGRDVEVGV